MTVNIRCSTTTLRTGRRGARVFLSVWNSMRPLLASMIILTFAGYLPAFTWRVPISSTRSGGGAGSDAKEVLIFSWDIQAEPAGLF